MARRWILPPAPSCAVTSARKRTEASGIPTYSPRTCTPGGSGFTTCQAPTATTRASTADATRRHGRCGRERVRTAGRGCGVSGAAIADRARFLREARERRAAGAGLARQHRAQFLGGAGLAEQASLREVATRLAQEFELALGFHALGHHFHAKAAAHLDDGAHDGGVIAVDVGVAHERLVDLQRADGELLQRR